MARSRNRSTALARYAPRVARPIIMRTTKVIKAKRRHHRSGGASARGLFSASRMGIATGAFALGMLDKSAITIPELPLIGKAGTIGIAAYFLSGGGRNKFLDEMATAALAVAAYELGSTGKVVGGDYTAGF